MCRKVNKQLYTLARQSERGEYFKVNSNNQYQFRKGYYSGKTVNYLYEENPGRFLEYLYELFALVNIIDQKVIVEIVKELSPKR
ncbi:MAG: hypothetical protein EOO06_00410 [Chitinophagaceae bacterium]|nr:MAG: hypothetical protein EOO06_00410 [Chitinophagaceae bacterium]